MRETIEKLLDQGYSRNAVFEQLRGQVGNELRLANRIATIRVQCETGVPVTLNRILLCLSIIQALFAVWVLQSVWIPLDQVIVLLGIFVVSVLTVLYLIGLARMAFIGYTAFLFFCFTVAANYMYAFQFFPVISLMGLLLALMNGALTYYLKVLIYPHMGMLDVRKDGRGRYILE